MKKVIISVIVLAALMVASYVFPVKEWWIFFIEWIQANPEIASVAYVVAYILATVLMIPGSIITLAGGYVFGVIYGSVLVSIASCTGALIAFLLGRTVLRSWVETQADKMPRFKAFDKALERKGFFLVLLVRLSPIFPFNLLNYMLGLSGVSVKNFLIASWLGMLPGTVAYVYLGSVSRDLAAIFSGDLETGITGKILMVVGIVSSLLIVWFSAKMASKALNQELDSN